MTMGNSDDEDENEKIRLTENIRIFAPYFEQTWRICLLPSNALYKIGKIVYRHKRRLIP